MSQNLERRIENFLQRLKYETNSFSISGTYHQIKATILDYKKYDQPYNKRKVNKLLPKMEIEYKEWQKKIEKNHEQKRRDYPPTKMLIKELKNQDKK